MAAMTGMYKGRKYRVAWRGRTKYGERAKLAYWDGSKEFWVPASAVDIVEGQGDHDSVGLRIGDGSSYRAGVTAPHGRTCPQCGSRECERAWDSDAPCDM